jgi:hypothetical protein
MGVTMFTDDPLHICLTVRLKRSPRASHRLARRVVRAGEWLEPETGLLRGAPLMEARYL